MLRWINQQKGGKTMENLESMTKKEIIQLLTITRGVVHDYRNQLVRKAEDEKKAEEARIEAEKARPNRFGLTIRVHRKNGTIDTIQNVLPRLEEGESMNFDIHPAVNVNG